VGPYIVDFACLSPRLIVEVDGGVHRSNIYDHERSRRREEWLRGQKFRLIRFTDREVLEHPLSVREAILKAAGRRA
jgi:very-short-patch-repair endonuclease